MLAAGQGKRMKSDLPKVLHSGLRPSHAAARPDAAAGPVGAARTVVVLGHGHDLVEPYLPGRVRGRAAGTADGHGTRRACARRNRSFPGPFAGPGRRHAAHHRRGAAAHWCDDHRHSGAAATVLTMDLDDPTGYGRVVRDETGDVLKIVEHRDATAEERRSARSTAACTSCRRRWPLEILTGRGQRQRPGEIYLTDVIAGLRAQGERVAA